MGDALHRAADCCQAFEHHVALLDEQAVGAVDGEKRLGHLGMRWAQGHEFDHALAPLGRDAETFGHR